MCNWKIHIVVLSAACEDAYEVVNGDRDACIVGCNSQLPFAQRKHYQVSIFFFVIYLFIIK